MQDITFTAQLESAKLTVHADGDKNVRRVQFRMTADFGIEIAEWLGMEASDMRQLMIRGGLGKFSLPIDRYAAKAELSGSGNTKATLFGVVANAKMSGGEEPEPMIDLTFEAHPDAALLTWIAASLKATCSVELKAVRLEMESEAA